MQTFPKTKQNFKSKNIATKNIHSEECFKGHKTAEGFSLTSSVSLTSLLKILPELQKDMSKSHVISQKKDEKSQYKFSQMYCAKTPGRERNMGREAQQKGYS